MNMTVKLPGFIAGMLVLGVVYKLSGHLDVGWFMVLLPVTINLVLVLSWALAGAINKLLTK